MKNIFIVITCFFATHSALASDMRAPQKRVRFDNIIPSTDFPFLLKPYLPDKITHSKKPTGEWGEAVHICFSPTGVSDSNHRLALWGTELYLINTKTDGVEFLCIDPYTSHVAVSDELPSADSSGIQYFDNITLFNDINHLMMEIVRALRIKIARPENENFLRVNFKEKQYRITQHDDNMFYITDRTATTYPHNRPVLLIHFLFTHWVLNKPRITIECIEQPTKRSCAIL